MEERKPKRYLPVLILLAVFAMLTVALIGQNFWLGNKKADGESVSILEKDSFESAAQGQQNLDQRLECLYLWDSREENSQILHEQMPQILRDMKVDFQEIDVSRQEIPSLEGFEKAILGYGDYAKTRDEIVGLSDWVSEGGQLLIALVPEGRGVTEWLLGKAGVESIGGAYYTTTGLRLQDELLLGGVKSEYEISAPFESSMTVVLDDECQISVTSNDESELPLLWQRSFHDGKYVVVNLGIYEKGYRGIYAAAYSMLGETCVWPVVNGSAFYIDDFPSPVPDGENPYIAEDYGMNTEDFYTQVWWQDISSMAEKYGIRFSGMVVETYSGETQGPFPSAPDSQTFSYFGNSLLTLGGEIGLHGYNHLPLRVAGTRKEEAMDGSLWPDAAQMQASLKELISFCEDLFPGNEFQVYAPPANILSEEGRSLIAEEFPQIRAIAGVYQGDETMYTQEYEVAEDGLIETPRILSGYLLDSASDLYAMSELNLHYVSSHYQHPYDLLTAETGGEAGWEEAYRRLCGYADWLESAALGLRKLTASEMAGAVQRFYYVDVERELTEEGLTLTLSNFQDEAWFLARFNDWEPDISEGVVSGGTIEHLQGNLYLIKAEEAEVTVKKKVEA